MTCCKCRLLKKVQALAFAVHETVLYLDGHPCDRTALEYYRIQKKKLEEAKAEYEARFGMLTHYGTDASDSWQWVKGPWPWEFAANVCPETEVRHVAVR